MTVSKLTDFKDWISPMIVKELRQGTRTRIFSFAFILLLSALMIVMMTSLAANKTNMTGSSVAFWFCVVIAFLVVMPLRGFGAISNEMRMQTLDMVLLTRLSSTRIIFGKWAALYSQTLLVASALLPFVVIRYFLGGVDFLDELLWLGLLVLTSGALTGIMVGLSAQSSLLLRGVVALAMISFGIGFAGNFSMMFVRRGGMMASSEFWQFLVTYFITCVFATYYMLAMGATHFAPISENHSTRKRLVTLLYIAAMVGFYLMDFEEEMIIVISAFVLAVVIIDTLTEHPAPVASVYIPFVKRGALGRLAGKLLYPGWQSGLLFTAIIVAVFMGLLSGMNQHFDDEEWAVVFSMIGMLLFPAAIIQLAFSRHPNPFGLFILISLLALVACSLVAMIDNTGNTEILWFLCLLPVACIFLANEYRTSDETIMMVSFVVTCLWLLILVFKAIPLHRQINRLENVVKDLIDKEGATAGDVADAGDASTRGEG